MNLVIANKKEHPKQDSKGFTLIELLVVIALDR